LYAAAPDERRARPDGADKNKDKSRSDQTIAQTAWEISSVCAEKAKKADP